MSTVRVRFIIDEEHSETPALARQFAPDPFGSHLVLKSASD